MALVNFALQSAHRFPHLAFLLPRPTHPVPEVIADQGMAVEETKKRRNLRDRRSDGYMCSFCGVPQKDHNCPHKAVRRRPSQELSPEKKPTRFFPSQSQSHQRAPAIRRPSTGRNPHETRKRGPYKCQACGLPKVSECVCICTICNKPIRGPPDQKCTCTATKKRKAAAKSDESTTISSGKKFAFFS